MTKLDLDDTIELMLSTTLAPFATSLEQRPGVVIQPELKGLDTANRAALELLQQLGAGEEAVLRRKLQLEETIGEGGMGVVHLATQRTIGRKVAVKTLRLEHFPAALGYLAGSGLTIIWPEGRYFIIKGCQLMMGLIAAVWWPRQRDAPMPGADQGTSR